MRIGLCCPEPRNAINAYRVQLGLALRGNEHKPAHLAEIAQQPDLFDGPRHVRDPRQHFTGPRHRSDAAPGSLLAWERLDGVLPATGIVEQAFRTNAPGVNAHG